jgi:membrane protease YdiL (CAAX protease family)
MRLIESSPTPSRRAILARVLFSPDERRLRAAWRLLLHTALVSLLLLAFTLPVAVLASILSGPIAASSASYSPPLLLTSSLASLAAIALATWIARRALDRRSFLSLGLRLDRHTLPDLVLGFLIAGPTIGLIFLFEWLMGWVRVDGWAWQGGAWLSTLIGLLSALVLWISVGIQEEVWSRGYHLQNLADGLNLPWGLFLSSAIFGGLHLANPNATWLAGMGVLAAGYFLAFGWLRTRQLWLPIGLHIGWNFFEGTVFGFPVSGMGGFSLLRQTVAGPTLVTGGAFGPEAGLIVLPALGFGALLLWAYTRRRLP